MAISKDKERIAVSLTKEQVADFDAVAKEMGITKSTLMQIATIQYVNAYRQSKSVLSDVLTSALGRALDGKEIDVEQLRSKNIL